MNKKVLYTATSDIHIKAFHFPYLKWLKSEGFEVHLALENRGNIDLSFCDFVHYIPFKRSPFSLENWNAFRKLKSIISTYNFSIIHCHTPTVSALTRLSAIKAKGNGTKVLYTAHGFHFFKGAPLKYWISYYVAEKILSYFTDGIITINQEDYNLIREKFWNKHSFMIKGIGINTEKFKTVSELDKVELRRRNNIPDSSFLLLYIAEFIPRKNHEFLLRAIPYLKAEIPELKVLLAGTGVLFEEMKNLVYRLQIEDSVVFFGWRDDVGELAAMSDIGISTSKQEGLGLGLAEEMLCSLPIVASMDRGHREMIIHGKNGYMFEQGSTEQFVKYVIELYSDKEKYKAFSKAAYIKAQDFLISNSLESMANIYRKFY